MEVAEDPLMRYIVTGGFGVIGSSFIDRVMLADPDNKVLIIDNGLSPRSEWVKSRLDVAWGNRIESHTLPLQSYPSDWLAELIDTSDILFHAAAHTGIPHSSIDPKDDWASNVDATMNLLEALRKSTNKIPMVALSSVKPYKVSHLPVYVNNKRYMWTNPTITVDETFELEPDEPYAASKMAQSGLCMAYARSYGLPVTVLRCSNLYGAAPCHGPRHGWLTWLCIQAALGVEIEIQGTGYQVRDMLYASDVATAVEAAVANIGAVSGNVYNIGGGARNSISVLEAVSKLGSLVGSVKTRVAPGRQSEDRIFITNWHKFNGATSWAPLVTVDEGMKNIVQWATANADALRRIYGI